MPLLYFHSNVRLRRLLAGFNEVQYATDTAPFEISIGQTHYIYTEDNSNDLTLQIHYMRAASNRKGMRQSSLGGTFPLRGGPCPALKNNR